MKMRRVPWLVLSLLALTLGGCSGVSFLIGFDPPSGPIPPGERAECRVTVRHIGTGDSWAGRKVRVTVRAPDDLSVEPAEATVTLDDRGSGIVRLFVTPGKDARGGPRRLLVTASGGWNAKTSLDVPVVVK